MERHVLKTHYGGQGEAEVVPLYQLAPIIRRWIDDWEAEHEWNNGRQLNGPYRYLAEHSGVDERRIRAIANGDTEYYPGLCVSLTHADAILCAAGLCGYLYDVVQVVPNPNWSLERWMAYMEERGCI